MRGIRYLVVWAAVAASAHGGPAAGAEPRPELALRDVLWQLLPDDVRSVSVGLDDRIWIELDGADVEPDAAKETIAREFSRPVPQLVGVRPVLFEPGGRVWFSSRTNRFLLGHDGREWIEKKIEQTRWFTGACPENFCEASQPRNQLAGGRAFFPETHGVHVFDGRAWSWFETTRPGEAFVSQRLIREPDGEGILLMKGTNQPELWRFRDGDWSQIACAMEGVAEVCPAPDGKVWLLRRDGRVETVSIKADAGAGGEAEARKLGEQLRAATTADERRAAAQALAASASPAVLEELLASSYDAEVLAALTRAIKGKRQPSTSRLGEYSAATATLIAHDDACTTTLLAVRGAARGDTPLGDGLLVVRSRQQPRFIAATQAADIRKAIEIRPRVIFSRDGRSAWVAGADRAADPFRLDLETGAVSDRIPEPLFGMLHAVRDDGTVFVSNASPSAPGAMVAAFRPGRPDDYVPLPTESWPLAASGSGPGFLGLDAAGGIWAALADRGLARFHDDAWQPVNAGDPRMVRGMLAGSRGDVILIGSRYGYWRAGEISWATTMKELLAANREAIAASFGAVPRPRDFFSGCAVAADGAGHLWLLDGSGGGLSVLVGDHWIDAQPALMRAESRHGLVRFLAAAGGGTVYVSDLSTAHDGGRSFFGAVEAGQPVFRDAPNTYLESYRGQPLRDHRGALWLPTTKRVATVSSDLILGQLAIRIAEGRVDAEVKNEGWAAVSDAGGVVWLAHAERRPPGTIHLWRDGGQGAGTMVIPGWCNGSGDQAAALFSDRPGSVVARTARGLTHFVSTGEPATYRVAARYALTGVEGVFTTVACTPSGVVVGTTRTGGFTPLSSQSIVLVRLPRIPVPDPSPAGKP